MAYCKWIHCCVFYFPCKLIASRIITDHNNVEGGTQAQKIAREKYADQIKVLVGEEYVRFFTY